jgi:dTDP-4-dehydrorhamnose 3,5-epimerase-like enzyme
MDMNQREKKLWAGLSETAGKALAQRDYKATSLAQRLVQSGVAGGELAAADRRSPDIKKIWIPGVEIFQREVHSQPHRGVFGEFVRQDEGVLARIGLWPKQWSAARMFAHSAKGFHIHPPSIPPGTTAQKWQRRLFVSEPQKFSLRPYEREQWDVMFFLQGRAEMILRDVRAGLSMRTMRFFVDGDNHRGRNNVGVVIPPGVAHAIRSEGSEDVVMVYGTSTTFHPEFEGRIASDVETSHLPEAWEKFLGKGD